MPNPIRKSGFLNPLKIIFEIFTFNKKKSQVPQIQFSSRSLTFSNDKLKNNTTSGMLKKLYQQTSIILPSFSIHKYGPREFGKQQRFENRRYFSTESDGHDSKDKKNHNFVKSKEGEVLTIIVAFITIMVILAIIWKADKEKYEERFKPIFEGVGGFLKELLFIKELLKLIKSDIFLLGEENLKLKKDIQILQEELEKCKKKLEEYEQLEEVKHLSEYMEGFQTKLRELEPNLNQIKQGILDVFSKNIEEEQAKQIQQQLIEKQQELNLKQQEIQGYRDRIAELENNGQNNLKQINNLNNELIKSEQQKKILQETVDELHTKKTEIIETTKKSLNSFEIKFRLLEAVMAQILSSTELNVADIHMIRNALDPSTTQFDFNHLQFTPSGLRCVNVIMKETWQQNRPIMEINFGNCSFNQSENKLAIITENLVNYSIENLNLEHNFLHYNRGVESIVDIIRNTKTIKKLILNNNSLTDNDIKLITEALKENNSIEHLIVHTNSFTEIGIKYLKKLLEEGSKNSTLMTIDVHNNRGISINTPEIKRQNFSAKSNNLDEEEKFGSTPGFK